MPHTNIPFFYCHHSCFTCNRDLQVGMLCNHHLDKDVCRFKCREICSRETLCRCSAENCGKKEIDNKATNCRKMYFAIWFNYIEACHQSVFFQYVRYLGSICFIGTHLEIMLCQVRFAGSKLFVTSFKSFSTNNKYKHPCELNV